LDALAEQSSGDELFGERRNRRMPAGKGRVCSGSPLVAAYGSEEVGRDDFKNRGLKPPLAAAYLKAVECLPSQRPAACMSATGGKHESQKIEAKRLWPSLAPSFQGAGPVKGARGSVEPQRRP
jgi:hypothetical protein